MTRAGEGIEVAEGLPTLAVFYEPGSFSLFEIAASAKDLCELLWVVDSRGFDGPRSALLRRLGRMIDVASLDAASVALSLAAASVRGIVAYTDALLEPASRAAAMLDLPFHSRTVAAALSDKAIQRRQLERHGVEVPPYWPVGAGTSPRVAALLLAGAEPPVVVKPTRGSASRGVSVVVSREELLRTVSGSHEDLLVEGLLGRASRTPSDETTEVAASLVSVETVVEHGVQRHLGLTGRFPHAWPFRETGSFLPSDLNDHQSEEVRTMVSRALLALEVERGFFHTEVMLTSEGPRIVEINGRIGGGIPQMNLARGGADLLRWTMLAALGESTASLVMAGMGVGYFLWEQPPASAQSVATITGLHRVASVPGVSEVASGRGPGDNVNWREGATTRVYSVSGWVADHSQLWERRQEIRRLVEITYKMETSSAGGVLP